MDEIAKSVEFLVYYIQGSRGLHNVERLGLRKNNIISTTHDSRHMKVSGAIGSYMNDDWTEAGRQCGLGVGPLRFKEMFLS